MLSLELDQIADRLLFDPRVRRLKANQFRLQNLQFHLVAEVRAEALFIVLLRLELHAQLRVSAELGERQLRPSLEESEVDLVREKERFGG